MSYLNGIIEKRFLNKDIKDPYDENSELWKTDVNVFWKTRGFRLNNNLCLADIHAFIAYTYVGYVPRLPFYLRLGLPVSEEISKTILKNTPCDFKYDKDKDPFHRSNYSSFIVGIQCVLNKKSRQYDHKSGEFKYYDNFAGWFEDDLLYGCHICEKEVLDFKNSIGLTTKELLNKLVEPIQLTVLRLKDIEKRLINEHQHDIERSEEDDRDKIIKDRIFTEMINTELNPLDYGTWKSRPGNPTIWGGTNGYVKFH